MWFRLIVLNLCSTTFAIKSCIVADDTFSRKQLLPCCDVIHFIWWLLVDDYCGSYVVRWLLISTWSRDSDIDSKYSNSFESLLVQCRSFASALTGSDHLIGVIFFDGKLRKSIFYHILSMTLMLMSSFLQYCYCGIEIACNQLYWKFITNNTTSGLLLLSGRCWGISGFGLTSCNFTLYEFYSVGADALLWIAELRMNSKFSADFFGHRRGTTIHSLRSECLNGNWAYILIAVDVRWF